MQLTPAQVHTLRVIKRTAAVYLVLLCLNRPAGEAEIARALDMNRQTVRLHLQSLSAASLVTRTHFHAGWVLTQGGRQMFLSASPQPGEIYPVAAITTIKESNLLKESLTAVEDSSCKNDPLEELGSQKLPSPPAPDYDRDSPVWQALLEAGITPNARTLRLAAMQHLTPEYVRAHHLGLQAVDKGHHTGLLITILEAGTPAPELNQRGHLETCNCDECRRDKYVW